jgi:hypothetical protein
MHKKWQLKKCIVVISTLFKKREDKVVLMLGRVDEVSRTYFLLTHLAIPNHRNSRMEKGNKKKERMLNAPS